MSSFLARAAYVPVDRVKEELAAREGKCFERLKPFMDLPIPKYGDFQTCMAQARARASAWEAMGADGLGRTSGG